MTARAVRTTRVAIWRQHADGPSLHERMPIGQFFQSIPAEKSVTDTGQRAERDWGGRVSGACGWGCVMLGERIRVARARARLTLRDVASKCDCTPQAVKKWEDDQSMPDSRKFLAICRELDVSAEWLMAPEPLDFHSTETAPQGRHAKYWVREAVAEMKELGILHSPPPETDK